MPEAIVFLEAPTVGARAKISKQGQSAITSMIEQIDQIGSEYRVKTTSGTWYQGPIHQTTIYNAPAQPAPQPVAAPTQPQQYLPQTRIDDQNWWIAGHMFHIMATMSHVAFAMIHPAWLLLTLPYHAAITFQSIIGYVIGGAKGRQGAGYGLSTWFGVIGWIITFTLPPGDTHRHLYGR